MEYLSKLKGILLHPRTVLEEYKVEEGMSNPFQFMLISTVIAAIILLIFELIKGISVTDSLIGAVFVIIWQLVIVFVVSGLFHLLVKLFGGLNPFYQTFKAFAYMSAFSVITSILTGLELFVPFMAILRFIIGIWVLVLLGSSLKHYTDLSSGKLVAIWAIVIVLIAAAVYGGLLALLPFSA